MPTIQQLIRKPRTQKVYREKARHMQACPQKRGVCTRVYTCLLYTSDAADE